MADKTPEDELQAALDRYHSATGKWVSVSIHTPAANGRPFVLPQKREAGVYPARGIGDLSMIVSNLSEDGFRIVSVIDTQNGDYQVVAQKE